MKRIFRLNLLFWVIRRTIIVSALMASGILTSPVCGKDVSTMQVVFQRTTIERGDTTIQDGVLYFQPPSTVTVTITTPTEQWLRFEGQNLLILYPRERLAFAISSSDPIPLPLQQFFIGHFEDDLDLSSKGFEIESTISQGDTLITKWIPSGKSATKVKAIRLALVKDRLASSQVCDENGTPIAETFYRSYISVGARSFPLEVESLRHETDREMKEIIKYAKPEYDVKLPSEIVDFKIPSDVKVENYEL